MSNEAPPPPPVHGPDVGPPPPAPLKNPAQMAREQALAEIADRTFDSQINYAILMTLLAVVGLVALVVVALLIS